MSNFDTLALKTNTDLIKKQDFDIIRCLTPIKPTGCDYYDCYAFLNIDY